MLAKAQLRLIEAGKINPETYSRTDPVLLDALEETKGKFIKVAKMEINNLLSVPRRDVSVEQAFEKISRNNREGAKTLKTLFEARMVTTDNIKGFSISPLSLRIFLMVANEPRFFSAVRGYNGEDKALCYLAHGLTRMGPQGRQIELLQNEFGPNPKLSREIYKFLIKRGYINPAHTGGNVAYLARGTEITKLLKG